MDSYYTIMEDREQDRIGRAAQLRGEAYKALFNEFKEAFYSDPTQFVRTPGYGDRHERSSLMDMIADDLHDEVLYDALILIRDAALGEDIQLRAKLVIDGILNRGAMYHCDDLANQMEDDQ